MDPLSTVNKTYHLVQQVERQKLITTISSAEMDVSAFFAKKLEVRRNNDDIKGGKGPSKLLCKHCKAKGHSMEKCLQLIE